MVRVALALILAGSFASAQDAEKYRKLRDLLGDRKLRGTVTAVAGEISLLVVSIGKDEGVTEGEELKIFRGDRLIAKAIVDRTDRKWSAAKTFWKEVDPRVGDDVSTGGLFTVEQKKAFLEYALSFRPVTDDDRKRVKALVSDLDHDDVDVRDTAVRGLIRLGGLARAVLAATDTASLSAEAAARMKDVMKDLDQMNRLLQSDGLERDVEYLAVADDPRAYERLKRILSSVPPFSTSPFPEKRPGLEEYLKGWWVYSKHHVRWNPEADRFEER